MTILPSTRTPTEEAFEVAIARAGEIAVPIDRLWDPDRCPAEVLPWLAWALSVDTWDPDWPEGVRREVIRQSVGIHRRKGTLASVRAILAAAGYGDAEIRETDTDQLHDATILRDGSTTYAPADHWAEYRLRLERPVTVAQGQQVRAILRATAPARCHLRELNFTAAAHLHSGSITRDGTHAYGAT